MSTTATCNVIKSEHIREKQESREGERRVAV